MEHRYRHTQDYLALAGLVAPVVFVLGVILAGWTWDGYSHRTQNISDLGGTQAPYAILQNVNFGVFGVLVAALAVGLRRSHVGRHTLAAPVLLAYFGAMLAVMGLAPCTPGCAEGTLTDMVHSLAALTGFLAFVVSTFVVWLRLRAQPELATYAAYSAVTGTLTLVFLLGWLTAGAVDPEQLHAGALQRVFVGAVLLWLGVTGAQLRYSA